MSALRGSTLRTLCAVCALLLSVLEAGAEGELQLRRASRVFIDDVVAGVDGEPLVDLYVRAETRIGQPLTAVAPSSLSIRDNGEVIDPSRVEVSLVAEAGVGTSAVLVLDTSRSMRGAPFDDAKAAALRFLDRMGDFDHVAIVAFDDGVRVVSDFGAPRTATRVALEELEVQPKTLSKLTWDGVFQATALLEKRPETLPRRSFVILFSDGRDSNSSHSREEVETLASGELGGPRTPVFTIGYSRFGGTGLDSLEALARATGGGHFHATSTADLPRFFDEIWERMTESLVVRYPGRMDGLDHVIEVTIGERSDSRSARFPEIAAPLWPWVLALVGALAGAAGVFVYLRSRSAGRLVFEGGAHSGQSLPLRSGRRRIGALEDNDLVLNYPTVSRYHAQLHITGRRVIVEDLGSRNGTYVNGTLIAARAELKPGDLIRFGDVEMIYRR